MVTKQKILGSVGNSFQALAGIRAKQEILIAIAEQLGFSLRDVDRGLSHAIVFGGAAGPGDVWPLGWIQARESLNEAEIKAIEAGYLKIIDEKFPAELKKEHPKVFV